jgi:hypothetical protein
MQRVMLKDKNFLVVGFVEIHDDGKKTLKDNNYIIKGYYDPETNMTKDAHFIFVGYGDLLTTLL